MVGAAHTAGRCHRSPCIAVARLSSRLRQRQSAWRNHSGRSWECDDSVLQNIDKERACILQNIYMAAPAYPLQSVDRALTLVSMLKEGDLRVVDAAARLGVAQSTAHRL